MVGARWNELALGFYRGLGAETMDEWITHRLIGERSRASRRARALRRGDSPAAARTALWRAARR